MPTLELLMIVKNGGPGLARCLASVRGIVDRITIGDTGSIDDTIQIARSFGANVVPVRWENDFAAARNTVLNRATCDWILVLDADEMLDPRAATQIPLLIADSAIAGYDATAWNYVLDAGFRSGGEQARRNPVLVPETSAFPSYFPSGNTRLFRRDPGIYFEHCVHETVADRLDALHLRRIPAPFIVHHFGYVEDVETQRALKENLYYELALKKVVGSPTSFEANLGAGMAELDHAKRAAAALPYFNKAIALLPQCALGWLYASICFVRLGVYADALTFVQHAISLDPLHVLAASTLGDIYFQGNKKAEARAAYTHAIELGDDSPLTLAKLGATEVHLGMSSGIARVQAALHRAPSNAELYDIYATTAFLAGQHAVACETAVHRLEMDNPSAFNFLLAATLHLHSGMNQKAHMLVEDGISHHPDDPALHGMLASLENIAP